MNISDIPRTQNVWYSWPISPNAIDDESFLYQYVRITGAATLGTRHHDAGEAQAIIDVCQRVADDTGETVRIGICHSPFFRTAYRGRGVEIMVRNELLKYARQVEALSELVDRSPFTVNSVLLDAEEFSGGVADFPEIGAAYSKISGMTRGLFPQATIRWYGDGLQRDQSETGWSRPNHLPNMQLGDQWSATLYRTNDVHLCRATVDRNAAEFPGTEGFVWINLHGGYRRVVGGDKPFEWVSEDPHAPIANSWQLGFEANHPWVAQEPRNQRYAEWRRVAGGAFYPGPTWHPSFVPHFVAFALGAHNINTPEAAQVIESL